MKKWIYAQAAMVVGMVILGLLIKIQLTPVAQAEEIQNNSFELLVQTENELVPYSQVKIIKVAVSEPDRDDKPQNSVLVTFPYRHRQDIQALIYEIEPELGNTLIRLAHCESTLNPDAVGDEGNSYGLFQIFLKWHPDVTQEQAQNIEFATKWTANKIRQGQGDLWTCWDMI